MLDYDDWMDVYGDDVFAECEYLLDQEPLDMLPDSMREEIIHIVCDKRYNDYVGDMMEDAYERQKDELINL